MITGDKAAMHRQIHDTDTQAAPLRPGDQEMRPSAI